MKKVLLTVATLLAVSTGAMAADFAPKNDTNNFIPPHKKTPRLIENSYNEYTGTAPSGCSFSGCNPRPR